MSEKRSGGGGRIVRARQLGGLAVGHTARVATSKAAGIGRSDEVKLEARRAQQMATADRIVEVLGSMKGAAMKIGQTLSVVDIGLVDPEFRDEFEQRLAALHSTADPVPFRDMQKVIEKDLGQRLGDAFADFDEHAVAAASIGQVYRARTKDGRDVAVKAQYPGIEQSIRADLQNLDMIIKVLSRFLAAGVDVNGVAAEIGDRLRAELDYELEASNQRAMARAYRGHPFVVVPEPLTDLCGNRVIVSEWVDGRPMADVASGDAGMRHDQAEILFRFYVNGPLRHRLLNGDPHPGNALFLEDGRVAFLDFGFFQQLSKRDLDELHAVLRAAGEADDDALRRVLVQTGMIGEQAESVQTFREMLHSVCSWFLVDGTVALRRGQTAEAVGALTQIQRNGVVDGGLAVPAHHAVTMRAFGLVFGILSQLEAENNWHRIFREIVYDDEPVTELGRLEAEYLKNR